MIGPRFSLKALWKALAIKSTDRGAPSDDADRSQSSDPRSPTPMPNEIRRLQNFRERTCYASDQATLGTNHHATVSNAIELPVRRRWLRDDSERLSVDSYFPILPTGSEICGDERSGINR